MPRPWEQLSEWTEFALEVRGEALARARKTLAKRRDPRERLLRRRRRAKRRAVRGATATGVLGGSSSLMFLLPVSGVHLVSEAVADVAGLGLGGMATAAGLATVGAVLKYRKLNRIPLPEPAPEPVELPPASSQAREPMRRLRDAEQSLHTSLVQLTAAGSVPDEVVPEARATAASTATALRRLANRVQAVEGAIPHAPASERAELQADVGRLREELDEGVDQYGKLVAAAGRAVAASGSPEQRELIQDATDQLAGLAKALRELSGREPSS